MRRTMEVLGACALTAMFLGNVFAAPPEASPPAGATAEDHPAAQIAEEIRQKLHQPITLELRDIAIRDAMEELLGKNKVDFWLDEVAIKESGVALDEIEVSCKLHNVSMRAALKRVLSQAKLGWVCDDAGVRITSPQMALTTFPRVYDVADLLDGPAVEVTAPHLTLQQAQFGGGAASGGVGPGPITAPEERAAQEAKEAKAAAAPERILIKMIQEATGGLPNGPWMEADGEGGSVHFIQTTHSKLLVVRQTEQVQAEIEDLLNELISHHHDIGGEEMEASGPKNAARIRVRPPTQSVVKKGLQKLPTY